MNKQINSRIKQKRDTSSNWTSNDPVLLYGEIIVVDTNEGEIRLKVGDGTKRYSQLPFLDESIRNLISQSSIKTYKEVVSFNGETKTVNHNLNTENIFISGFDNDKNSVWIDYTIINSNSINIKTDNINKNISISIIGL